jgi:citrate lyase beta subunit
MQTTLTPDHLQSLTGRLQAANLAAARRYPGESGRRQPVHTVYGGAHLFRADAVKKLGELALRALAEYAPTPAELARAIGLDDPALADKVHARVQDKLRREPVEDFRIDFEDGYGTRPDAEEDAQAVAAAGEVARGLAEGSLPPFLGIRIKTFSEELRGRSVRTLDLFLGELVRRTGGRLPDNFVVTLPKITCPEQVELLADLFDALEPRLGLPAGSLALELMVETPQSIYDADGQVALPRLVAAARGRCTGAHFGTYDYTASMQITASHQHMAHPACDFARHVMQVALAGTGVWLSDGATNVMPAPRHRGAALTAEQQAENRAIVHRAWRLHHDHVRHSLVGAYYQGWDLHPAQLPTRYAAVYTFFLEGLEAAGERLKNFVEKAAQATLVGDVFDDAATGQGLLNYFLRAINCGAVTEDEALARTGLTLEDLRSRSFVKILERRRG